VKILLRDRNPEMVNAWKEAFKDEPEVECTIGDIFDTRADAIVSPANSFGFMMGGIDAVYASRWPDLQKTLRDHLNEHHFGELPVGLATVVRTGDDNDGIPYMISAPTMRVSSSIRGTVNAYLAFRAALAAVCRHNRETAQPGFKAIETLLCPGLGTAVGMMDPHVAARQMRIAYDAVVKRKNQAPSDPGQMYDHHFKMVGDQPRLPAPSATLPAPAVNASPSLQDQLDKANKKLKSFQAKLKELQLPKTTKPKPKPALKKKKQVVLKKSVKKR
jgi:O-acetyl-ADP-ribose deacetylase (regulator of RNase III)